MEKRMQDLIRQSRIIGECSSIRTVGSWTHSFRGRALSFQLVNASDGGSSYTWSSLALDENFTNGKVPMPLVVADGRAPGEFLIPGNTTVFEFNPWEFGTFDPTTYGFVRASDLRFPGRVTLI